MQYHVSYYHLLVPHHCLCLIKPCHGRINSVSAYARVVEEFSHQRPTILFLACREADTTAVNQYARAAALKVALATAMVPSTPSAAPTTTFFCRQDIISASAANYITQCVTNCCSQDTLASDLSTAMKILYEFRSQWTDQAITTAPATTTVETSVPTTTAVVTVTSNSALTQSSQINGISEPSLLIWTCLGLLISLVILLSMR